LQNSKACNTLDNFELWTDEDLTHTVRIPWSYKLVKLALSRYKRIKKRNCGYTFIENSCFEIYPTLDGIVMSPTLSCSVVWRLIKGAVGYTRRTSFSTASNFGNGDAGFVYNVFIFSSTSSLSSS